MRTPFLRLNGSAVIGIQAPSSYTGTYLNSYGVIELLNGWAFQISSATTNTNNTNMSGYSITGQSVNVNRSTEITSVGINLQNKWSTLSAGTIIKVFGVRT